ncbi:MAG TPA: FtsQ-type POTRA domain-containing protein [Actinomycetota bacterium]|nr:FtsQ-type POTRA domain-containing protein [Actinomycetota bacterium]
MVRTADRVVRSPRIAERRREVRAQRRRRRRHIIIALVIVGGIGFGAWALVRSSVFSLQRIDVVGATSVSKQQIIDASGLHIGQSALGISYATVAGRIEAVPGVARARVVREGSLGVKIIIVERTAALEVLTAAGNIFLDQHGVQISANPNGPSVPIVKLPFSMDITRFTPDDENNVLAIWAKMPTSMRGQLQSFDLLADHSVSIHLGSTTVIFGTADQIDRKLLAVQLVSARVAADHKRLVRIDVRAPDHPAAVIS